MSKRGDVFALGEHHNPPFFSSSPTTTLGYIAATTERLLLSTATTLITTNDPVKIAEDFAMLQHVADVALALAPDLEHVARDVAADPHVPRLLERLAAEPGAAADVEQQARPARRQLEHLERALRHLRLHVDHARVVEVLAGLDLIVVDLGRGLELGPLGGRHGCVVAAKAGAGDGVAGLRRHRRARETHRNQRRPRTATASRSTTTAIGSRTPTRIARRNSR